MHYFVGDLQGCCEGLERLLGELGFSPSRDHLLVLGDLINRGPASLATLARLHALGDAATFLLGNHDLNFLAVAAGLRKPGKRDTLAELLNSPQREAWVDWLRHQGRLADLQHGWLAVHAGVVPSWSTRDTLAYAGEIEAALRGPGYVDLLAQMYGDAPERWQPGLTGAARFRAIVNVLTRIRFCAADDTLDLTTKEGADAAPPGFKPWFDQPHRATANQPIAFGHWSTLGLINRPNLLALDTGCVWGGLLTAVRVDGGRRDVVQVACAQAQRP